MGINLHPDCMHRIDQKEGTGFKRMIFTSAFLIWRGILLRSPRLFNAPPTRIYVPTICGRIRKVLCILGHLALWFSAHSDLHFDSNAKFLCIHTQIMYMSTFSKSKSTPPYKPSKPILGFSTWSTQLLDKVPGYGGKHIHPWYGFVVPVEKKKILLSPCIR